MWMSLSWICALGSSIIDLEGDVMDELSWKIAPWVEVHTPCNNAALQERQCRTLQQQ
jgi:hypothetical protein